MKQTHPPLEGNPNPATELFVVTTIKNGVVIMDKYQLKIWKLELEEKFRKSAQKFGPKWRYHGTKEMLERAEQRMRGPKCKCESKPLIDIEKQARAMIWC